MGNLKGIIQHEVHLFEPNSLEKYFNMNKKVENKNMATRRVTTNNYREHNVPSPNLTQLTWLKPEKIDEIREKRLRFNCDNNYSMGNKCGEKKLL
jgi:hypothetical protein